MDSASIAEDGQAAAIVAASITLEDEEMALQLARKRKEGLERVFRKFSQGSEM